MARDVLFEIGCEELPASFVEPALADLSRIVTERLGHARLPHGTISTFGTPRRLALLIHDVADASEDVVREVTGPAARAGFDAEGRPTRAAEKFAESVGLTVEALHRATTPKGEYLAARVEEKGRPALGLLSEALSAAAHGIDFKKSMRWGDVEQTFARPVQWLAALLGEEVIPLVFGDVKSGRITHAHRFLSPAPITLATPAEWLPAMVHGGVVPDVKARRELLHQRVREAASRAGGTLLEDAALLDQVVNLVEQPSPVVGSFDPRHLDLPPEVLIQEMKGHQRYFSVLDADGKLLPRFIAVSNTPVKDEALSLRGYERVLEARLSDGRFFFDEDRKQPLAGRVEKLGRVVWQGRLGSYAEKVERFRQLALWLGAATGHAELSATIERAATLAKADLITGMVGEFPELQGVMGREYARADGEGEAVALAIFEHYLPRGAGDALPTRDEGALVGLADRLDTLCGIFAIGKGPSGAADPFALRRACLAIINVVLGRGYRFSLAAAVDQALGLLSPRLEGVKRKSGEAPVREQVLDFFRGRLRAAWTEDGRADVVEAVLAAGYDDLVDARLRLSALSSLVGRPDFAPLAATFKRVANIVEKQGQDVSPGPVDPALLVEASERELQSAVESARAGFDRHVAANDFAGALPTITALKPSVDRFFDDVMVMAEDRQVRENRVRLLMSIGAMFGRVADFSKLQAE